MKHFNFGFLAAIVFFAFMNAENAQAQQSASSEGKSGLSAVRLVGPKAPLEKMAKAAARVGWTASNFDDKGRLVLSIPPNYTSADFGRLLGAIDPYTSRLKGLQMLGPNGGVVDDKGVEHLDK